MPPFAIVAMGLGVVVLVSLIARANRKGGGGADMDGSADTDGDFDDGGGKRDGGGNSDGGGD